MRKAIIVILTIFIILGFSSCDALLEGFFPDFADEATLEIYADVEFFTADSIYENTPVYIVIEEIGGENKKLSIEFKAGDGSLTKSVTVPRRNLKVWACVDYNENNTVDFATDFSASAAYYYDTNSEEIYDNCDLTNTEIGDNIRVGIYLGPSSKDIPDSTPIP